MTLLITLSIILKNNSIHAAVIFLQLKKIQEENWY